MSPIDPRDKEASEYLSMGLDPNNLTDQDILEAMKRISGYLDITPGDFKEVYKVAYAQAHKRILSTPARDIMTSPVHYVHANQPVLEVAKMLARIQVAGVPVVETEGGAVVGVISEKDFMHRMTDTEQNFMGLVASCMGSKGCPALKIKGQAAADIMSSPAVTVSPEEPVHAMYEIMQEKNINRIPVVENGSLIGIVSRDDLLDALAFIPGRDKN
ncbi:CBS domain-containing protein [Desulfovermiculus halophilus]|uniref:CBS domain-containing protein n=1 Tax=Desulfovermiculus halophilus TaxID=339722 RepID=UPI000687BA9C|nr:CBS domain-containing protein [Desulfovermiculus halophilus]